MQVLTEIGEVGVHTNGDVRVLRPTLHAMTQLGDPEEVVRTYAAVMQGSLIDALAVIHACADDDLTDIFGYYEPTDKGSVYTAGQASVDHVIALARALVRHGVTGALEPLPRRADSEPEYVAGFMAREHVAIAVAHLGLSEREAWNMTMTSLVGALRSKFPPGANDAPGARAPTKEEHEATMDWFEKIEARRKATQGAH